MPTMPEAPLRSRYDWVSYALNFVKPHSTVIQAICMVTAAVVCEELAKLGGHLRVRCSFHHITATARHASRKTSTGHSRAGWALANL